MKIYEGEDGFGNKGAVFEFESGDEDRLRRSIDCPICEIPMETAESRVPTCGRCRGVWLPASWYSVALKNPVEPDVLFRVLSSGGEETTFRCPACGAGPLTASTYGEVELDWCGECRGIWFDQGELERVRSMRAVSAPNSSGEVKTLGDRAAWVGGFLFELLDLIDL